MDWIQNHLLAVTGVDITRNTPVIRGASKRLDRLVVALLCVSVAQAIDFPEYPFRPAKCYPRAVTQSGLTAAAEALPRPESQKQYFHLEFVKKNYLPIVVVVDNESPADSFMLKSEDVAVYLAGDEKTNLNAVASGRSKGGEGLMLGSALALSVPGELIAAHMMVRATEIRQNVIKKELRSVTLAPGRTARGFIYIQLPKGAYEVGRLRMRVRVTRVGEDKPIDLELSL